MRRRNKREASLWTDCGLCGLSSKNLGAGKVENERIFGKGDVKSRLKDQMLAWEGG